MERTGTRLSTGVAGLDEVLQGGLLSERVYHIRGGPGCGKTTLGLHFLAADPQAQAVHVTFGERPEQLRADFSDLAGALQAIEILDLSPAPSHLQSHPAYDLFHSDEVEVAPVFERIQEAASRLRPRRVFIDSLTQLRYLSPDPAQFRSQVLALLRTFTDQGATVLFTSEASGEAPDDDLRFLSDGVITLTLEADGSRSLEVSKLRGSGFLSGKHDLTLGDAQGIQVRPRLVPSHYGSRFEPQVINSGVPRIDQLIGGGVHRGTTTLLAGPSGSGKTTLGMQFMKEAAGRGESSALFLFEEDPATLLHRADALQMPLRGMLERGTLHLERVEPLHYTPTQLAHLLRHQVEERDVRLVMLDSIAGYQLALRGQDPLLELHTLSQYLKNMGVTVLLVNEINARSAAELRSSSFDLSPLVDNVLLFNLVVEEGRLRKQLRMLKRRTGGFDERAAYLAFTPYGLEVEELGAGQQAV